MGKIPRDWTKQKNIKQKENEYLKFWNATFPWLDHVHKFIGGFL